VLLREAKEAAEDARREAESARVAAEGATRAKSDFLAAMSHEIRTPMTAVLGMADLLAAEEMTEQQQGYVAVALASGRHLLAVINDILDLSRIEVGGVEFERVDFRLAEVLEQARSLLASQALERGLALSLALDEGLPPVVRGDPTRLRQVLLNLVGNALKFTHEGEVAVSASRGRPAWTRRARQTTSGSRFATLVSAYSLRGRRGCSSRSAKATVRPRDATGAPGLASPSVGGWSRPWAA
jgi:signal transduction histidine kinase